MFLSYGIDPRLISVLKLNVDVFIVLLQNIGNAIETSAMIIILKILTQIKYVSMATTQRLTFRY